MPHCPKCSTEIQSDFGMMNCTSCGAMISINFDGSVDLSEDLENLSDESSFINPDSSVDMQENIIEQTAIESDFAENEMTFKGSDIPAPVPENEPEPESEEPHTETKWHDAVAENENVFEKEELVRSQNLDSPDMSDVEDFANSELSSSPVGGILYDLQLTGIDNAEVKEEIRLELSDKKYRLNVDALLNAIEDGKMVIRSLNAVKTALIVKHLMHLDIEIQWKQNEVIRM